MLSIPDVWVRASSSRFEGFEAALIVAIVLAFVKRSDRPIRPSGCGPAPAWRSPSPSSSGSSSVTLDGLEGGARLRTFAVICIAAAVPADLDDLLDAPHARALKGELEGKAAAAIAAQSGVALALVAGVAVLREGLETALFLISTTTNDGGGSVIAGTLLGLAAAPCSASIVYQGAHKFNMRLFFQITGVLIIMFAAGLVSRAILFLQAGGDLGSWNATTSTT